MEGGNGIEAAGRMPTVDGCGEPVEEMDDSQLVGVSVMVDADSAAAGGEASSEVCVVEVREEVKVKESGCEKRKRGRPGRGQARPPPAKRKKEKEEEDVCFICFDGGSLVLCDRRGCPKAYHPACIKRDEAFFRSRAKWSCGWHICTVCQKAAHYMCYTCPYSLCKACTKDSNYLCVRENKGFCMVCMRTVMLIENNDQGSKEMAQVDFDDKSSWEYLFKVYWIYLKRKLSLTLDELIQAKNPWKAAGTVACKGKPLNMHYGGNDGKCSVLDGTNGQLQANNSKGKRIDEQPQLANNVVSPSTEKPCSDRGTNSTGSTLWASKELLEFVGHMKNGDTSVLSQFDIQGLLLDYIKRNNLRDPRRKSQIICDLRLKTLFGKPCVGHFEMLKLLEFHFITKEDSRKDVTIQGNDVDAVLSQVEGGGNNENLLMIGKDKKPKNCRKVEQRGPQTNLDEYAAIDVHNINLIYLRRTLMESLIADNGKSHDKVVGAIVRIRISCSDQKPDMYRLVQVIGTCWAAVPYKIGDKTTDVMLEILNLDKKETISIDVISNQEFSEDECRRFRQSIKCGLVKRLTVGQVQQKAMALQEVRLNDWLETEILRLNHLRDRASEKGHKKELRECIEKLELLKTPEERHRRLHEIPEIHADPNMDPNYESDEDAGEVSNKKQDEYVKPRYSGFNRYGKEPISSRNADNSNESDNRVNKKIANCTQSRRVSTKFYLDKGAPNRVVERLNGSSWHEAKYACGSNSFENLGNRVDSSGSVVGCWNNQAMMRSVSFAEGASETSIASRSTGSAPSANDNETDKLWHYRDPNGKIQGPFCMEQLRKWNKTGYFPVDMRIWSIYDEEVDSLLLTDVLNGKFHKVLQLRNISLPSQEVKGVSDTGLCGQSGSMDTTGVDNRHSCRGWTCSTAVVHSTCNNEFVKGDGWGSYSCNWTTPVVNNNVQTRSSQCCDSQMVNRSFSDQLQVRSVPSSKFTEKQNEKPWHQGKDDEGERWNSGPNNGNWRSHGDAIFQTTVGWSHENQSDAQGYSGQSSGGSWRGLPLNFSSNNHGFVSLAESTDSLELKLEIDNPNLPSPKPKASNEDLEGQITKDQMSLPSALVQDAGIQKLLSPTPESSDGDEKADSSNNLPGPSSKPVGGNERVCCNIQNLASSLPKPVDGHEKIDSNTQNLPSSSPMPVDGDEKSDSSIQNLPSPPLKPVDGDEKIDSNIQNLPCPLSKKPREGDEKVQASENKQPVSSDIPVQDSGPSWSSASSLVVGGERQLSEIADDSGGYSSRAKPSVEEWDSGIASVSSLKPPEMASDHAATPTSKFDQVPSPSPSDPVSSLKLPEIASDHAATPTSKCDLVTPPSPSDPITNASGWQVIITEPIEFCTLAEESVSDLLAEVDAMESQCGLPSPTSVMYSCQELFQDSNHDYFPSISGLSPLDSGKSDALSSTGDIQLPHQSTLTSQADFLDPRRSCSGQSSSSAEVEVEIWPNDISANQMEAGSNSQLPALSTSCQDTMGTNAAHRAWPKPMNPGWGTMQGDVNFSLGGLTRGMVDVGAGTQNGNLTGGSPPGVMGWDSQPRYGGERFDAPRDLACSGGVGSYSRSLPKGQRVCKFYESGYCRFGAFCNYLHPR